MGTSQGGDGARRYDVVALVASAGGLEAFASVLGALGEAVPAAVLVQQHLGRESVLAEILTRLTGLPVAWAEDGAALTPGSVLVARPRHRLEVLDAATVASLLNEVGALSHPHDALLTSLGRSCGHRAVAVVLTGTGNDATAGAAALRAAGGLVLAQTPASAEHPAMPASVIDAGDVDLVLPLSEIGTVLGEVLRGQGVSAR